jgi:cell division protein FtsQ
VTERPQDHQAQPIERPRRSGRVRALTGLLVLGGLAGAAWQLAYWEPRLLPIRVIEVQGELHPHSSEMLQQTISERLRGGFLTANLQELKEAADSISWVGGASIRRVWPDRLQVRVEEHKPIARWNDKDLVTAEGLVFHPRGGAIPAGLPTLAGDDRRAPEVVARYLKWRDDLMLAGHLIQVLGVDARGAWSLELVSAVRLELGTEQVEQRLRRFLANAAQLEAAGEPKVVDLRYSNGFAVTWRRGATAQSAAAAPSTTAQAANSKPKAPPDRTKKVQRAKPKTTTGKAATAAKDRVPAFKTGPSKAPTAAQTQTDRSARSANGG